MDWNWKILKENYSAAVEDNIVEFTPSAGPNYRRLSKFSSNEIISGVLVLSVDEYIQFREFYVRDTKQGEDRFVYYDARYGAERYARFYGGISASSNSNKIEVNLSLWLYALPKAIPEVWTMNGETVLLNGKETQLLRRR